MSLWPRLRPRHYGYPYAAPVLRRDYRLPFVLLCFAGFVACMWGVFA